MKGGEVAKELCGPQESGVSLLLPSSIDKAFEGDVKVETGLYETKIRKTAPFPELSRRN